MASPRALCLRSLPGTSVPWSNPPLRCVRAIQKPRACVLRPSGRSASVYRKVERSATYGGQLPQEITDTLDHAIQSRSARVVDENNKLQEARPLAALISGIDRQTEHVRKVGEDEAGTPIVKVVSKASLVALVRMKELDAVRKDVSELTKQVELNWAIDGNDLGYRLRRMEDFLREGKRVEVMIAPKKKGRRAERDEIMGLLVKIKDTVQGIEGASEWKPMEGLPGKVVEMFFRGTAGKQSREEVREVLDEKRSKKDAQKEARRLKEEARLAQRKAELEAAEEEKVRLARQVAEEAKRRLKQ